MDKQKATNAIRNWDKTQFLDLLGLRERESRAGAILKTAGLIGAGAVIGLGIGYLTAPASGRKLRGDLSRRLRSGASHVTERVRDGVDGVRGGAADAQLAGA